MVLLPPILFNFWRKGQFGPLQIYYFQFRVTIGTIDDLANHKALHRNLGLAFGTMGHRMFLLCFVYTRLLTNSGKQKRSSSFLQGKDEEH
jgi:hypothetical protein